MTKKERKEQIVQKVRELAILLQLNPKMFEDNDVDKDLFTVVHDDEMDILSIQIDLHRI